MSQSKPKSCDTFVAFPPLSPPETVIFGKNSDRPSGEKQSICRYPSQSYDILKNPTVECTYITIPQVPKTNAILLSQIDWMWGCEMGCNEFGVVIGNEAVWTKEQEEDNSYKALLGMDLVRLGLERGNTAKESLDVITNLLYTYGQGGPCAQNDDSFTYDNSYLIVDYTEAWVLETAGRCWVAERVENGGRNISNGLTIRTKFDLSSPNLLEYAKKKNLWNGQEPFDFAKIFTDGDVDENLSNDSRQCQGGILMDKHNGDLDHNAMISILRDHESGICMHGGFETTSSMVSRLHKNSATHWMTGSKNPCKSEFLVQSIVKD